MSRHQRTYDETLSRALHAAADQIEPSGDGLERIRARLGPPMPAPAAWLHTSYQRVAGQLLGQLTSLGAWLESLAGQIADRYRPGARDDSGGSAPMRWLRPAGAAATAAVIVVMGVFAIRTLPQAISPAQFNKPAQQNPPGSGGGPGSAAGSGSSVSSSTLPGGFGSVPAPESSQSSCSSVAPLPNNSPPPGVTTSPTAPPPASSPPPSTPPPTPSSTPPSPSPDTSPSQTQAVGQASPSTGPGTAAGALAQEQAPSELTGSQPAGKAARLAGSTSRHRARPRSTPSCGG
jgi:hypothetical protein